MAISLRMMRVTLVIFLALALTISAPVSGDVPVDQAQASASIMVKSYAMRGVQYKNLGGSVFVCLPGSYRSSVRSFKPPDFFKAKWHFAGEKQSYTATNWTPIIGEVIVEAVYQ